MAIEIPTREDAASFSQNISVLEQSITITLNFNSTDLKWRLSLYNADDTPIILGRVLAANTSPTRRYSLDQFVGGNFWVLQKKETDEILNYNNFGFNKAYGLFFLTTDEEEALEL